MGVLTVIMIGLSGAPLAGGAATPVIAAESGGTAAAGSEGFLALEAATLLFL